MSSVIEPQPQNSSSEKPTKEKPMTTSPTSHRSVQIGVAIVRFILPILILAIAVTAAIMLVKSRPPAPRIDQAPRRTLVEAITPNVVNDRVLIIGFGTVESYRRLTIQPQVGGLVKKVDPSLITGGLVRKGDLLFQIDPRDFELVVEQRKADVADAKVGLQMAEAGRLVAEREWELLGGTIETTELGEQLARKEPQKREAEAMLSAAQSRLKLAELDLDRTKTTAPFNALVLQESVEVGQVISPLTPVATLVGTDNFEIVASIPIEKLPWIKANQNNPEQNSTATIVLELGDGQTVKRTARVARIGGEVERAGRLAKVILLLDDPLALATDSTKQKLLLGSYVRVEIEGPEIEGVMELPRFLVHEKDTIWVITSDNTLEIRPIEVVSGRADIVFARVDLKPDEAIIASPLPVPIPGMPLERLGEKKATSITANESPEK